MTGCFAFSDPVCRRMFTCQLYIWRLAHSWSGRQEEGSGVIRLAGDKT